MPIGKIIKIEPEEFAFSPKDVSRMSAQELVVEHKKRVMRAPAFELGKPSKGWVLHDEVDYIDELELFWGKKWGAQGLGKLREVVVSPPTENEVRDVYFEDPIAYDVIYSYKAGKPDLESWREQHANMVETYSKEGILVHQFEPPVPAIGPYGFMFGITWAANVGQIIKGGAIPNREALHTLCRGVSSVVYRKVLDELGIPILYTVRGKGIAEISGCIWLDDHHLIVEDGYIMNREGIEQLKPILAMSGAKMIVMHTVGRLENIEWPAGGTSHPDMIVAIPDIGIAVLYPPMCDYAFVRFLKRMKFDIIEVLPENYKYATYNMVVLEPGKVVCPDGDTRTIKEMEKRGVDVIAIPFSEGVKVGGAVCCSTGKLVRDPGPAVEELVKKPLEEIAPDLL